MYPAHRIIKLSVPHTVPHMHATFPIRCLYVPEGKIYKICRFEYLYIEIK